MSMKILLPLTKEELETIKMVLNHSFDSGEPLSSSWNKKIKRLLVKLGGSNED